MTTTIKKWGNSLAVRLPRSLAAEQSLHEGSLVSVCSEDGRIVIQEVRVSVPQIQLDTLVSKISKKNLHTEVSWGNRTGKEVW